MLPILTSSSPMFSDVSMGGVSFDIRRINASTIPQGHIDSQLKGRDIIVLKQPRGDDIARDNSELLTELATEYQILRHDGIREHPNIIDFLGIIFHDAGSDCTPAIVPCLLLEYAEFGNLKSFQESGLGREITEKFDICRDVAEGLRYLHLCGAIHGDVKTSNMLVCKHQKRGFVVKLSDSGFATSVNNSQISGFTQHLEAPEIKQTSSPAQLVKLDIYSYGILVYSVLTNGSSYYDRLPPPVIHWQKTTNVLPGVLQLVLMEKLMDSKCLLLIFYKIITYCMKANPTERFHDMQEILELLDLANPRDIDIVLHKNEDLFAILTVPLSEYAISKSRLIDSFDRQLSDYFDAMKSSVVLDLAEELRDRYRQRMELEIEMIMSKPTEEDTTHYGYCPGLDDILWRFQYAVSVLKLPTSSPTSSNCGSSV